MQKVINQERISGDEVGCVILDWNGTIFNDAVAIYAATVNWLRALGYPTNI
jgi:beta-phosphoglucomutase-like phosphatase (HAD superfamily)